MAYISKVQIDDGEALDLKAAVSDEATKASSAEKLTTARTIQTNLASTTAASFNGTGNATPGVRGTLPLGNGGTNATTAAAARASLATAPEYGSTEPSSNLFNGLIWIANS